MDDLVKYFHEPKYFLVISKFIYALGYLWGNWSREPERQQDLVG